MRYLSLLLLCSLTLFGQVIPGRYIVELSEKPLGQLARLRTATAERSARAARIGDQQRVAARAVENRGGRVRSVTNAVMNALLVETGESEEALLRATPGAVKVYPVELMTASLDHALPLHHAQQAWAAVGGREHAGEGVKIAILDSGVQVDHPAFQDPTMKAPAGYPLASPEEDLKYTSGKIIVAREYRQFFNLTDPDDLRDRLGHGTSVAMCAAGVPNQGPFGYITGVAPKAWLGIYKIAPGSAGSAPTDVILKAVDDALADGMDVLNLSYGSQLVPNLENSGLAVGLDRATRFGMVVVVSAGNYGPAASSIGSNASVPTVISVGAAANDRTLNAAVEVQGVATALAQPRSGTLPEAPVSGVLKDLQTSNACSTLEPGSLTGAVALVISSGCLYETKMRNIEAAGGVAAIVWVSSATGNLVTMATGDAPLPAVMVSFADGRALRAAAESEGTRAKVSFRGVPFPADPAQTLSFSSRGPTYTGAIKPDLSAVGFVYTAAQNLDSHGSGYDASAYKAVNGTSFSSPIAAGAAAVLVGARPGLTVDQYRSLLINRATPMDVKGLGLQRVQRTGPGVLNLQDSLSGTVTAYPPSIGLGVGAGTVNFYDVLMLTNVGKTADTYTIRPIRYDDGPAPTFGDNARGLGAAATMTVTLAPGQSKPVYPFWRFDGALAGEYQGLIYVQGTAQGSNLFVPYWYAVPSGVPATISVPSSPSAQMSVSTNANIYFRVLDEVGIPITSLTTLRFQGTASEGGGSISQLAVSPSYPNTVYATIRTGATPGRNVYRIQFGSLPAVSLTVEGVKPAGQ
jgi:subtilisin family serine protease